MKNGTRPAALSLTAGELVGLLVEAGATLYQLEDELKIARSQLSRWRTSERKANEDDYRALCRLAIARKLAK